MGKVGSEPFPTVQTFSVQTRGVVRGLDSVHRFIGVFHGLAHKIIFGGLAHGNLFRGLAHEIIFDGLAHGNLFRGLAHET